MTKYKSWRVMPNYGHKHDENYNGYNTFKKKILEPLILTAAFGAIIYIAVLHDRTENQKKIQHTEHGRLEQILK